MKPITRAFCALALAAMLAGCLEFEEQALSFTHDAKTGTLRIFQDYRGICGSDQPEGLSQSEQNQLESVLTTPRTFFFANWIFEIDHRALRQSLADLRDPETRKKQNLTEEEAARIERLIQVLLAGSRIENGPFYTDAKGRLCAVQFVTFPRIAEVLQAMNDAIPDYLRREAAGKGTAPKDAAVMLAAAKHRKTFVSLDGNRFTITWPCTRAAFDQAFGPHAEADAKLAAFKRQGGTVSFADNEVTLSIGAASAPLTTLTLPISGKPATGNAMARVKDRATIREGYDPQAAMNDFIKPSR